MGFFGENKKRKYDPEIISKASNFVLSKHGSSIIAQREVQLLRDQASAYALEQYGAEIPPSAFMSTIKMTDFKDGDLRSKVVSYYKGDQSIERTASYFKTSAQTIKKILTEYGITIKTGLQTAVIVLAFQSTANAEVMEKAPWTLKELIDYGVLGVVCFLLVGYLGYLVKNHAEERRNLHKCHAEERKQWKYTTDKQHAESVELGKKVVEVLSEVKGAINTKRSNL